MFSIYNVILYKQIEKMHNSGVGQVKNLGYVEPCMIRVDIDGSVQECGISITDTLEIPQSYTKSSM